MTEDIKIKLSSELDSKGYDELRKMLNQSRNEMNALARSVEKGSKEWKTYKGVSKELNQLIKSSDADLKKYVKSIQDEERALKNAEKGTDKLSKSTKSLSDRFVITAGDITGAVSGIVNKLSGLVTSFNELENSNRKLYATSKLTGTSFTFLQETAKDAQVNLGLTTKDSNELTIALAKLGQKAGDTSKTKDALKSLMDLGSAQGLNVEESITAINQAILGIDEGTDKLFQKNPSVIYKEYADSIGTTAGKLTDQQKAQALLNETITQGSKVQGEYNKFLETSAGKQQLLKQKVEVLKQEFGEVVSKGIEPFIDALLKTNDTTSTVAGGVVLLGGSLGDILPIAAALKIAFPAMFSAAFVSTLGVVSAGVGGIASAVGLMYKNIQYGINLWNSGGGFIDFLTTGAFNQSSLIPNENNLQPSEGTNDLNNQFNNYLKKIDTVSGILKTSPIVSTTKKTSGTGGTPRETVNDVKKISNEILDLEGRILSLQESLSITTPGTTLFQKYTNEISDLRKAISLLEADAFDLSVKSTAVGVDFKRKPIDEVGIDPLEKFKADIEAEKKAKEEESPFSKTVGEVETINSSIISTMQLFNIGVESGIGAFLNGLSTAVQLIRTLQTVNSILGFIPGFAEGGNFFGNSPMLVGERGPELLFPKSSGFVMNNQDSQRYLNQTINSNASPVNIYIDSNIDALKFFRKEFPKYENFKRGSRIN